MEPMLVFVFICLLELLKDFIIPTIRAVYLSELSYFRVCSKTNRLLQILTYRKFYQDFGTGS